MSRPLYGTWRGACRRRRKEPGRLVMSPRAVAPYRSGTSCTGFARRLPLPYPSTLGASQVFDGAARVARWAALGVMVGSRAARGSRTPRTPLLGKLQAWHQANRDAEKQPRSLNRIADTLPLPPRVESYLRGYAAGLKR